MIEIGLDVEGEAVHRPAPREPHPDRADLALVGGAGVEPHAQPFSQGLASLHLAAGQAGVFRRFFCIP